MRLNRVVQEIPPSGIRRFFDIFSQMEDVISLGVGEPDFVTPCRLKYPRGFSEKPCTLLDRALTNGT